MTRPGRIVVMGVSGSGKTTVGRVLAGRYDVPFFDADDFHSTDSVEKMRAGIPLTDDDRTQWLERLSELLARHDNVVLACSALKRRYREQLSAHCETRTPIYLYLNGSFELIQQRLQERKGHYFAGENMLRSQFGDLEEPSVKVSAHVSIADPFDTVIQNCVTSIERFHNQN